MKQLYKIAGLVVAMDSFGRTILQAASYLCDSDEKPDIVICSNWPRHKTAYPNLSDNDGEYLATGANYFKQLLSVDGFQLHSSAVVVDGKAYLFTADSGTGKSTHTGLWLQKFGARVYSE